MGNREILREKDENKNFGNSLEYLKEIFIIVQN